MKIRKSAGSSNRLYRLEFDPLAPITRTGIHFLPALLAYRIGRLAAWLIYAHNEAALAGYRRGRLEVER